MSQSLRWMALEGEVEVVFGIPVEDTELLKAVRRVVVLSAAGAALYICHFVADLLRGRYQARNAIGLWSAMSSLLLELSVPACGYYGALRSNRQLMCCFCGCNLFIALVTLMTLIRLELHVVDGNCEGESNANDRRTCELWRGNSPEKHFMLFTMVAVVGLGCFAFLSGNRLYLRLSQDPVSLPTPVVGQVTTLWPLPSGVDSPVLVQSDATVSSSIPDVAGDGQSGALEESLADQTVPAPGGQALAAPSVRSEVPACDEPRAENAAAQEEAAVYHPRGAMDTSWECAENDYGYWDYYEDDDASDG